MGVGCAFVGNVFLVIALFYWVLAGSALYSFGIIAAGVLLQYVYDDWSKIVWRWMEK